jgi:hypothetical protein
MMKLFLKPPSLLLKLPLLLLEPLLPLRVRAPLHNPPLLPFNPLLQLLNLLAQSPLRKLTLKPNSKRMLQSSKI